MNSLFRRIRLGLWAAWNADRLTMLHFEMLRDAQDHERRHGYRTDLSIKAEHYAHQLSDMPGADDNRRAL